MVVALEPARSSSGSEPRSRFVGPSLLLVLACLTATACPGPAAGPDLGADASLGIVEFVIDGDTVDVLVAGEEERVRLIGIDTPESVSRDVPVQCFGQEASDALTGLLPPGTEVRIERDIEARDRYGRLLLYLHRADDDLFVNEWMIDQGFADTLFFEPNTSYEGRFTRLRNDARAAERGLWAACDGPDQPLE